MKKRNIILIAAGALALVLAGTAGIVATVQRARAAAEGHERVHGAYAELCEQARSLTVTVTENGAAVGVYDLETLGVLSGTLSAIDAAYSVPERMTPEEFAARPLAARLAWHDEAHAGDVRVPVAMEGFSAAAALADLQDMPRAAAQDAFVSFEEAAYTLNPEVPGTELREDVVADALREQLSGLVIGPEGAALSFEITDADCYLPPEVTVENGGFDFDENLAEDLSDMRITVKFLEGEEVLEGEDLAALVTVDGSGALVVDRASLDALIAGWAAAYSAYGVPYRFDSYKGGVVPIEFLPCDYVLQSAPLAEAIEARLLALESAAIEASYDCFDEDGAPFAIENTYLEVDIQNQYVAYYIDGELVVATDVVTGRVRGRDTPTGLYYSHDRRVNRWLIGSDYAVFVKYWVRIWNAYGLHDASWRDEFGGDIYLHDGSHGCVNIPEAAMAVIYEKIVDGTPVLVF